MRATRDSIDNRLELIRVRLHNMDPRRVPTRPVAAGAGLAVAAGLGLWAWSRRGRRLRSLEDLLRYGLAELYSAEAQIAEALPAMAAAASDPELRQVLTQHRRETELHLERLRRVFGGLRTRTRRRHVAAIAGIVEDTRRLMGRKPRPDVLDAALITAAQRVEHYGIAAYGAVRAHARTLGHAAAVTELEQTLEEEREMDERLTRLAERSVNIQAVSAPAD
jgi:ferritin-like metal-binding protein YciE